MSTSGPFNYSFLSFKIFTIDWCKSSDLSVCVVIEVSQSILHSGNHVNPDILDDNSLIFDIII